MICMYCDESDGSSHGDDAFSVVGWIARTESWVGFAEAWTAMLAHYQVQAFHSTDFENRRKEFAHGWDDVAKRAAFLNELGTIIGQHASHGRGHYTWRPYYDKRFARHRLITLGRT